jgi:hypothetical protein
MFGKTLAQVSDDDVEQRLALLCNDVRKGQVSADDLREIIKLCDKQTCNSVLLLKSCENLSFDLDASERQRLIDEVKYGLYFISDSLVLFGILYLRSGSSAKCL